MREFNDTINRFREQDIERERVFEDTVEAYQATVDTNFAAVTGQVG